MAKHPYLLRRKGSNNYYFRIRIPLDLIDLYGKKEVRFSLATSDHKEAVSKAKLEGVKYEQEFIERRRQKAAEVITELSSVEIERITQMWLHQLLEEDEASRFGDRYKNVEGKFNDKEFDEDEETIGALESLAKYDFARGISSHIQFEIDDFLDSHGVKLDQDSETYQRVCYAMQQTWTKALGIMKERHVGEVRPTPPAPAKLSTTPSKSADGPTLMEVFDKWVDERKPPKNTASDFGTYCRRFVELHGVIPIRSITKSHVREFKDAMLRFPSRLGRMSKFKNKTVPQLLEHVEKHPDTQCLSPRTVNDKALGAVAAVLSYATRNGYLEHNPASGIKVEVSKVAKNRRLSYSVDDLNKIFRFPIYTTGERPAGGAGEAAYWLPLLAAFTGARLEELGQLDVEDIKKERGVTFIDITNLDGQKHIKTESSKRRVPIHPELVRLGFLQYVKEFDSGRLFPRVVSSVDKLTAPFSKWWGNYARKHGITDKRKVFHSFRHAAKDALREGGVEEQISDAITGHAALTEGRKYGSQGVPITRLAEGVAKLTYPGLELSHLFKE